MRGTRASVVNSSNGGTPGGMMRSNAACSGAGYGGLMGSIRGAVIVGRIPPRPVFGPCYDNRSEESTASKTEVKSARRHATADGEAGESGPRFADGTPDYGAA